MLAQSSWLACSQSPCSQRHARQTNWLCPTQDPASEGHLAGLAGRSAQLVGLLRARARYGGPACLPLCRRAAQIDGEHRHKQLHAALNAEVGQVLCRQGDSVGRQSQEVAVAAAQQVARRQVPCEHPLLLALQEDVLGTRGWPAGNATIRSSASRSMLG